MMAKPKKFSVLKSFLKCLLVKIPVPRFFTQGENVNLHSSGTRNQVLAKAMNARSTLCRKELNLEP